MPLMTLAVLAPSLCALPIQPTPKQLLEELRRPKRDFIPARVGWDEGRQPVHDFNVTFELYGPQATARAVRASVLAALTPDPVAMAALLFCAFALRWMRMRHQDAGEKIEQELTAQPVVLPKAA
ncbi:MAG: hypothetical protein JOZ10_03990 [Acidobacteria bacterium]|nr:hypothetical protein [Acidobacteriota bacterium]